MNNNTGEHQIQITDLIKKARQQGIIADGELPTISISSVHPDLPGLLYRRGMLFLKYKEYVLAGR